MDTLSASQREALSQLQALTNGGDAEVAISVLQSVDWDVQVRFLTFLIGRERDSRTRLAARRRHRIRSKPFRSFINF